MAYGRINVGGGKDLTAELNQQAQIITQLEAKLDAVGAVDITPEVSENTDLIAQVMAELEGKAYATDPSVGATATADKIIEGYTAAVNGVLLTGTASAGLIPEMFGCTKMAVDKIVLSSDVSVAYGGSVNHSLGEIPRIAFIVAESVPTSYWHPYIACTIYNPTNNSGYTSEVHTNGQSTLVGAYGSTQVSATSTTAGFCIGGCALKAGIEYTLITMA